MNQITDISHWDLLWSFSMLLLPLAFMYYFRIALIKSTLISSVRMAVQLALVAVYLEWIFTQNNPWINSAWVLIMILVSVLTTIRRAQLRWQTIALPLFISVFSSLIIIDGFFLGFVIRLDNVFDARYFIPITGMILGNSLKHNIIGLNTYFSSLKTNAGLYQFVLSNTGKFKLALRPFIAEAVKKSMNPMLASMSVVGLISLPGMMTGQILGGSSPATAIKYQIMIMVAIFVGGALNLFLSIVLLNRMVFDDFKNFKDKEVLRSKK